MYPKTFPWNWYNLVSDLDNLASWYSEISLQCGNPGSIPLDNLVYDLEIAWSSFLFSDYGDIQNSLSEGDFEKGTCTLDEV